MTVTPLNQQGPLNFLVDTLASVGDIGTAYLDAGAMVLIADTGAIQIYTGTVWLDVALGASSASKVLTDVLAADFDVDSGTTGATITATDLAIAVPASRTWRLDCNLFCTWTTNGGIELDFTVPTSATMVWQGVFHDAAGTPLYVNDGENAFDGVLNYIATAGTFTRVSITGSITTSTTAGTLTLRGAQNTGHADNTIIHAGSSMTLFPV